MKRHKLNWLLGDALLLAVFSLMLPGTSAASVFEVVTSVPLETSISRANTRDAAVVWPEMINKAKSSIDIAEFYLAGEKGEALEPVIEALLAAGRRGVPVRILCEKSMTATYPETLARFSGQPGIAVRLFDWEPMSKGVLHAKYFIVDNRDAYVGSQNFDWRSLSHIHETGLRIRSPIFAAALERIFAADWQYSGGDKTIYQKLASGPPLRFAEDAFLVASPAPFNPPGVHGALETLIRLLDQAQERVTVQLLSYSVEGGKEGGPFILIDRALRRAARRGVRVQLLVSNWNLRRPHVDGLRELARVANIEIRFAVIPQAQQGFIPFARVIHSKVMRIDDDLCWVGTSNWGYDYFFSSRNIEVVLRRPAVARVLDELFLSLWNGPFVQRLDPDREYHPPRIN